MPAVAVPVPASAYSTVTAESLVGLRDTVNVRCFEPLSPSATLGLSIDKVGSPSSSRMVSVIAAGSAGAEPAIPPDTFPDTDTCLSASSASLSTADTVTNPLLAVCPAAIVSALFALRLKSDAVAPVPAAADTVTVTAADVARFRLAVTVDTLLSNWLSL